MTFTISRTRLMSGAALGLCTAAAALSFAGTAQAQSVCTNNTVPSPDTYACTNGGGTGTYSDAATFTPVAQGVQITGAVPATVTQAGTINTNNGASAVYVQTTGTPVTYTSTGTTATTAAGTLNTYVRGSSVNATTSTVTASGTGTRGVNTLSDAGTNTTVTGATTVTGDNGYGVYATSTGGLLNLTTGATTLTAGSATGGGFGILAISTGGTNTINASTTTFTANNATGISASATGGDLILNGGTVTGTGNTSFGINSSSTGANNTTSATNVTLSGNNNYGINATSNTGALIVNAGTVSVTGSTGGNYGIAASALNGTNTVNATNTTVSGAGSTGISATDTNGALIVNTGAVSATGAGSIGVRTSTLAGIGTCGTSTINVTGNVTGDTNAVNSDACGTGTITVNAGRTVSTTTAGGTTIRNNATTVATTTVNGTVNAGASGNLAIDNNGTSSATTIAAGGAVTGRFDGTTGIDTFTNGGTFTTSGTSDFQAGIDSLTNNGTITTTAPTTFANLETLLNVGTLNLSSGLFTISGVTTTSTTTGLRNSGTINATNGATTITATTGTATAATLNNTGTINLIDGATGDVLTITNNYAGGTGATLGLDVSGTAADSLVVQGVTTGVTGINVNLLGGPIVNTAGILVVDTNSVTSNFVLNDLSQTALIDYRLDQRGTDYFLVTTPNAIAFQPLALAGIATDLWYQSADIYTGYAALRRGDLGTDRKSGIGIWAQLYASRDRTGDRETVRAFGANFDVNNRVSTHRRGAQGGVDFSPAGGIFVVGLTAGYQHARADLRTNQGGFDLDGHNIGAYAIVGSATGLYGGALIKRDKSDVNLLNSAFGTANGRPDFKSTGIEGEVGFRFAMMGANLDAGAGLAHVKSKIDDFAAEGLGYDFGNIKSLRGRLGLRAGFGGSFGPYIDGKVYHEFKNDARVSLINGGQLSAIDNNGRDTWGRLEVGVGAHNGAGPIAALWGDIGDRKGVGVKGGFRF